MERGERERRTPPSFHTSIQCSSLWQYIWLLSLSICTYILWREGEDMEWHIGLCVWKEKVSRCSCPWWRKSIFMSSRLSLFEREVTDSVSAVGTSPLLLLQCGQQRRKKLEKLLEKRSHSVCCKRMDIREGFFLQTNPVWRERREENESWEWEKVNSLTRFYPVWNGQRVESSLFMMIIIIIRSTSFVYTLQLKLCAGLWGIFWSQLVTFTWKAMAMSDMDNGHCGKKCFLCVCERIFKEREREKRDEK